MVQNQLSDQVIYGPVVQGLRGVKVLLVIPRSESVNIVSGANLGWTVGERELNNEEIKRPYICEIKKNQIYRIIGETRGYGK